MSNRFNKMVRQTNKRKERKRFDTLTSGAGLAFLLSIAVVLIIQGIAYLITLI